MKYITIQNIGKKLQQSIRIAQNMQLLPGVAVLVALSHRTHAPLKLRGEGAWKLIALRFEKVDPAQKTISDKGSLGA